MTVPHRRRAWIAEQFSEATTARGGTRRLCELATSLTGMSGAGIVFVTNGIPSGSLGVTDRVAGLIEELEYTLGEGPAVDADRDGVAVLEPDLAASGSSHWVAFGPLATEAGVAAVFGFPLRVAAARVGVLELYRDRPGTLAGEQLDDAMLVVDIVARRLLDMQIDVGADAVGPALDVDADFRLIVHQAAGMVSVQLGSGLAEALVRLRAHAFGTGRPIAEVAESVVGRRLRFSDRHDGGR